MCVSVRLTCMYRHLMDKDGRCECARRRVSATSVRLTASPPDSNHAQKPCPVSANYTTWCPSLIMACLLALTTWAVSLRMLVVNWPSLYPATWSCDALMLLNPHPWQMIFPTYHVFVNRRIMVLGCCVTCAATTKYAAFCTCITSHRIASVILCIGRPALFYSNRMASFSYDEYLAPKSEKLSSPMQPYNETYQRVRFTGTTRGIDQAPQMVL
jgi:hypothetical protein